jgi:hypothetical protein
VPLVRRGQSSCAVRAPGSVCAPASRPDEQERGHRAGIGQGKGWGSRGYVDGQARGVGSQRSEMVRAGTKSKAEGCSVHMRRMTGGRDRDDAGRDALENGRGRRGSPGEGQRKERGGQRGDKLTLHAWRGRCSRLRHASTRALWYACHKSDWAWERRPAAVSPSTSGEGDGCGQEHFP